MSNPLTRKPTRKGKPKLHLPRMPMPKPTRLHGDGRRPKPATPRVAEEDVWVGEMGDYYSEDPWGEGRIG